MRYYALVLWFTVASIAQASSIIDLTEWTLLEDPPNAALTGTIDSPSQATLASSGGVGFGTAIGFASVNGAEVADSTSGFFFDPASDFEIAIDYDLSLVGLTGAAEIGFGVGEDVAGTNSAGIALGFANSGNSGDASLFETASRTNDVDGSTDFLPTAGSLQGRFFVGYEAASGNVTVGVNPTPGAASPSATRVLLAVQEGWTDSPLLASFSLSTQPSSLSVIPVIISGDVTAVFSNLTVLSGTPISIPEPGSALLASLALVASWRFPRTRSQARG